MLEATIVTATPILQKGGRLKLRWLHACGGARGGLGGHTLIMFDGEILEGKVVVLLSLPPSEGGEVIMAVRIHCWRVYDIC